MKNSPATFNLQKFWQPVLLAAALLFLYATTLARLGRAWWTDENYSHGLLIPFIIGYLLWLEKPRLEKIENRPAFLAGGLVVILAMLMLFVGTLGAELFTQRISFPIMLAGVILYFFGWLILRALFVPFLLLLLAIPIPSIIFNQIAFPLQLLATDIAVWGIRAFSIPVLKLGNVIELLPSGAAQTVRLEVVEACSGIRSLMTLVSLALLYAYFTRQNRTNNPTHRNWFSGLKNYDFWRAVILMISAVPIAVLTNAARVMITGILTYYYGAQMAEGLTHDASGWLVYLAALALLLLVGFSLDRARNLFVRQTLNVN